MGVLVDSDFKKYIKNGEIEIYGVLKRSGGDNKLGYTNQLYDTAQNKFQSKINKNNIDYKNEKTCLWIVGKEILDK